MVKLSDYLDYLYREVIQARKQIDEQSVELAKEYAKNEYLKYFRVPRFTMPSVKLDIPLKIDEIDAETKYNFRMNTESYIAEVNERIAKVNREKNLKIEPVTREKLEKNQINEVIKDLEKKDFRFVRRIEDSINTGKFGRDFQQLSEDFTTTDENSQIEKNELHFILRDSLKNQFTPVSARLNNIFIDPDTSKENDRNKIFVKLNVELVEEGLRIVKLKDEHGKEFEEIVFE